MNSEHADTALSDKGCSVRGSRDSGGAGKGIPRKYIVEDHSLIQVFRNTASFQKVISYIQGCSEAVRSTPYSERISRDAAECCPAARYFVEEYFPLLHQIITEVPLEDAAQQRFGNCAKRVFQSRMEETLVSCMEQLVRLFPSHPEPYACGEDGSERSPRSEEEVHQLALELAEYMKDAFGNPSRLDYGSGHELHFFVVVMLCLEEHGDKGGTLLDEPPILVPLTVPPPAPVPPARRDAVRKLRQDFVFHVLWDYWTLVRRLQKHYSLEPAGSHGVWGLDDYHHIPYILGAAQLIGKECPPPDHASGETGGAGHGAILTKHVCERDKVQLHQEDYLYFAMISWILANKSGPFFEHSNMLYNVSGVERWEKIYGGMLKMFAAEVLGKFNVSQHLLFGPHLPWGTHQLE